MMAKRTNIDRRAFLRGAGGVALTLPLLECMANDAHPEMPKRLLALYVGHGFALSGDWNWYPKLVDGQMHFGKSMEAFNPVSKRITVLQGLEHPQCVSAGGHSTADSFLTGSNPAAAVKSPSLDQIAAMTHGHKTRYPSLVLGNEGGLGGEGRSNTLSYNQFGRGVPSTNNLRGLYDAMFNSDPALQKQQRQRLNKDQRRVDRVLDSYREMKRQFGRDDSRKLEHYMQALRDVEKEIQRMERWSETPKPQVPADGLALNASVKDPAAFIRTMYNLIYLAFKTDSTRYATYMLQSMNSSKWDNIPIALGLGVTHHLLAHNAVQGGVHLEKLGQYDKFQADLLAEFITKLADTPEGEGTMLDNTIVLYGSSNSQTHVNTNYPMMLMGGEKLGLKQGAFHDFGEHAPPLSNLYLTLLDALDVPAEQFSDSNGTTSEIVA
tara:strand:+ start:1613 stop:2920 length:1308 start_codon:yes stop_codon:yes gene_type:complete